MIFLLKSFKNVFLVFGGFLFPVFTGSSPLTTQRWGIIQYYATHSTMFFLVIGRGL